MEKTAVRVILDQRTALLGADHRSALLEIAREVTPKPGYPGFRLRLGYPTLPKGT
jgi:hypothetical protein